MQRKDVPSKDDEKRSFIDIVNEDKNYKNSFSLTTLVKTIRMITVMKFSVLFVLHENLISLQIALKTWHWTQKHGALMIYRTSVTKTASKHDGLMESLLTM